MAFILASSSPLPPLGQIAAIIILVYIFFLIVIGVAITVVLALGMQWVREKVELIKRLRPTVDSVNTTTEATTRGNLPAAANENKVVRTIAEVPYYVHTVDNKVDQGSERVAGTVIEFRARAMMAKQMLKAFFLPGLKEREQTSLEREGVGLRRPGYTTPVEEQPVESQVSEYGAGYAGGIQSSQLRDAPVEVATTTPSELQNVPMQAPQQDAPPR